MLSGTSCRSFSLRFGRMTRVIPARCAANTFSFTPPIWGLKMNLAAQTYPYTLYSYVQILLIWRLYSKIFKTLFLFLVYKAIQIISTCKRQCWPSWLFKLSSISRLNNFQEFSPDVFIFFIPVVTNSMAQVFSENYKSNCINILKFLI